MRIYNVNLDKLRLFHQISPLSPPDNICCKLHQAPPPPPPPPAAKIIPEVVVAPAPLPVAIIQPALNDSFITITSEEEEEEEDNDYDSVDEFIENFNRRLKFRESGESLLSERPQQLPFVAPPPEPVAVLQPPIQRPKSTTKPKPKPKPNPRQNVPPFKRERNFVEENATFPKPWKVTSPMRNRYLRFK
jgi:hypothetical protein